MNDAVIERPLPIPDAATAPYWSAAHEGRLELPCCLDCRRRHFYPRTLCPHCGSARLEWAACSGRGVVYSYTVVHRAPSPAFAAEVPYVVAVVKLDEGPHLMTNIVGCPQTPQALQLDMPLAVTYEKQNEEDSLPLFKPAAG